MKNEKRHMLCFSFLLIFLQQAYPQAYSDERPLVFPTPLEIKFQQGRFEIDNSTFILLPEKPADTDNFLARLLYSDFSERFGQPVRITGKSAFPDKAKTILAGEISNPLVKQFCSDNNLTNTLKDLGDEGYLLFVKETIVLIAGNTKSGALFGVESLRQLITRNKGQLSVPCLSIVDKPRYPFRGIKLYLPGRENIPFFKRFIKDFAALYKFNTIILELNANMRLEKHPELNDGAVQFARYLNDQRLDRPSGLHNEFQNSSHQDNADGEILEKSEVADIVNYMRQFNLEVIPELPSLTHSYYLLWGHHELAENLTQPFPDTYCPLKPEIYEIYFDVLDEYIEVIRPSVIHAGHDEWRVEKDICELCRGKDYGELYANDLNKIHDYLATKGIRTAIWGDHLLESVTGKEFKARKSSTGYQYTIPGGLRPEQVLNSIPKDILIFNWFWDDTSNDKQISDFGFQQVYGNMQADITNWEIRSKVKSLLGGAPSSWAATCEKNFGKDLLIDFLGCSNLLWSGKYIPFERLVFIAEPRISGINYSFSGKKFPSDAGSKVIPLDISSSFDSEADTGLEMPDSGDLISGKVISGNKIFNLPEAEVGRRAVFTVSGKAEPGKGAVEIPVNRDVNSIIFLHACAKEAVNDKAYRMIHNFDETAELLGWYEIVYVDGFIETVPLRYGVNILDWRWQQRIAGSEKPIVNTSQNQYAYNAPAVQCSKNNDNPINFFAYEWINPRPGKQILRISLKPVTGTKNNKNSIILLAVSITESDKAK